MYLPERLQEQSFMTWNHTIKGLMRLWEIAHKLGLEQSLEQRMREDMDGTIALRLGKLGNDPRGLANVYRQCLQVTLHTPVPLPIDEAPRPGFLKLPELRWDGDPDAEQWSLENSLRDEAVVEMPQRCGR